MFFRRYLLRIKLWEIEMSSQRTTHMPSPRSQELEMQQPAEAFPTGAEPTSLSTKNPAWCTALLKKCCRTIWNHHWEEILVAFLRIFPGQNLPCQNSKSLKKKTIQDLDHWKIGSKNSWLKQSATTKTDRTQTITEYRNRWNRGENVMAQWSYGTARQPRLKQPWHIQSKVRPEWVEKQT